VDSQPELIADRAYALRTCPAKVPSIDLEQIPDLDEYEANADWLLPVADTVQEYLDSLPDTQWAHVYLDTPQRRVIAQVKHGISEVLAELSARVEEPDSLAVEQVRYSRAELDEWAEKIIALDERDDLGLSGISSGTSNNRLDVDVQGEAEEAWRRIAEVVDPCAFRVEGGVGLAMAIPSF
jgi:hypothetical protein